MLKLGFKSLVFPKDESWHNSVVEWWYFNGNLKDSEGKQYAFMYCFFKVDPRKIRLPFIKKMGLKLQNFYFSHHLLSNIEGKKFFDSQVHQVLLL